MTPEQKEIQQLMLKMSDVEIMKYAEEMDIPVEKVSDTELKDKGKTILFLIEGGCPNCGKAK